MIKKTIIFACFPCKSGNSIIDIQFAKSLDGYWPLPDGTSVCPFERGTIFGLTSIINAKLNRFGSNLENHIFSQKAVCETTINDSELVVLKKIAKSNGWTMV